MPATGNPLRAAALLAFVVLSILMSLLVSSVQQLGGRRSPSARRGSASALRSQLSERRRDLLPLLLLQHAAAEDGDGGTSGPPGKSRLSAPPGRPQEPVSDDGVWTQITHGASAARPGEMGCDSLVDMQAVEVLGSGYTKLVVRVNLAGGQPAALKLVNENGIDMSKCVEDFRDPQGCRELVSYKLKKELVLLQRLQHPNVIKVRHQLWGNFYTFTIPWFLSFRTPVRIGMWNS